MFVAQKKIENASCSSSVLGKFMSKLMSRHIHSGLSLKNFLKLKKFNIYAQLHIDSALQYRAPVEYTVNCRGRIFEI